METDGSLVTSLIASQKYLSGAGGMSPEGNLFSLNNILRPSGPSLQIQMESLLYQAFLHILRDHDGSFERYEARGTAELWDSFPM